MSTKYRFDNMDASENAFFSRQLEQIRPGILEVKRAELKSSLFVPRATEISPGADEYTYRFFDQVGKSKLIADYADDLPRADVKGQEASVKMRSHGSSYGYNFQEIRGAMMAGLDLSNRKAMAARNAIAHLNDDIMLLGDGSAPYLELYGLFKLSGTCTYTVPDGGEGQGEWEYKTPDEILLDMHGMVKKVIDTTLEEERPDSMILPLSSFQLVSNKRLGDGSDQTILKHFLATNEYVKSVASSVKLETAGAGSVKRAMVYERNPDKVEGLYAVEFEQFAPQQRNFEVITPCHSRVGGVVAYYPKSICYADGI